MRLAYVCADAGVPVFGRKGASIHVQEVVRALGRAGARVELFAARAGGPAPPGLEGVRLHRLPRPSRGLDPEARERLARGANAALAAALAAQAPFDAIYERYSLWSWAAMEHARERGLPAILEVNAPLVEEQAQHRELVDREGALAVAGRAFAAASALVAVSQGVAEWLAEFPSAGGRVHVVPNGVDPERFPPALPDPDRPFTVGFVGTLKPWHGLELLAEAFGRLRERAPAARLLVVGDGPERERLLRDLAARGAGDAARLVGSIPPAAVPAWLARMDVGVAPYAMTPRFYFSPLKVLEYMAAGLPVVASRIGQIAELVEDGVTGILCPPGDAAALTGALDALRSDAPRRARLGAAARAAVRRHHSWDAVVRAILERAGLAPGGAAASAERS